MSRVTLTGRAGADIELRFAPSGVAVGKTRVAESHRRKVNGEWQDDGTSWYDVTLFGKKAEDAADVVRKGALLVITGDLRIRDYEARDGQKGRAVEIVADEVGVVPIAGAGGARPRHGGQQAPEDPWAKDGQW